MKQRPKVSNLLLDNERLPNKADKEVFLLMGDLNVDCIKNENKFSQKFNTEPEFDVSEHIEFYKSQGLLKEDRPEVNFNTL